MALQPIEGQDSKLTVSLASTCLQTEMKNNPASLGVTCGQQVESPAVAGILNRDYRYK